MHASKPLQLASTGAVNVPLEDLLTVANTLAVLRRIGAHEQVATLLARDLASFVVLNADRQADAAFLLSELHTADADDRARLLISRLPAGGLFDLFCAQAEHESV